MSADENVVCECAVYRYAAPMGGLCTRWWGEGDRVAVLLHGMTTDSGSWWAVGPALAARGYRVVAPDLPGPRRQPT
ncbi:alpha/beta fold hydrolase [Gordonia hankookensis]|uniref:alpha/beta fold hydrolase n=1 Tax=Gordonia hankookensis TaxID=589403 RepID=UPI0029549FF4|nr:alpha/beta fold hydrolase [Gordonia hankookensis]